MTAFNHSTYRRLKKLQQVPGVWEGDRRSLPSSFNLNTGSESNEQGECVIWVDGSQGMVRAMDVVTPEAGPEAVVRTLLKAMEHPHSQAHPGRPQKIVVRDREIQFFLRGALQQLEIAIDYTPELPLIDEIFRGLQATTEPQPPEIPPQYAEILEQKAHTIWHDDKPWEFLDEHQILAIQLNRWDLDTLYASVLMEQGILLYRSLDSLKRFRQRMLSDESLEQLEEAFLGQDCLFLTFETTSDVEAADTENFAALPQKTLGSVKTRQRKSPLSEICPTFGNLHPLEGLRSVLYEEEALTVLVALEALHRFFHQHRHTLAVETFSAISSRYRIPIPQAGRSNQQVSVKIETLPELAVELLEMMAAVEADPTEDDLGLLPNDPIVQDDLIPQNSYLSLGVVPWEMVEYLRAGVEHYQPGEVTVAGDGLPIILVQTSRPKAKTLIKDIQQAGGLRGICFNPGEDPFDGDHYDIGILQTENEHFHLFGEFMQDDPVHIEARKKWDKRCKKTKGWCGLVIAKGITGAARGNPQLREMMALLEARSLSAEELGLGILELKLEVDWV